MPTTKDTCVKPEYAGKLYWCENTTSGSWSSNGWCSMMPCNQEQCEVKYGKDHWCANTYSGSAGGGTSGWCQSMSKCNTPGMMWCPDGATQVSRLKDCPKKGTDVVKVCPDGTVVPYNSVCPEPGKKKTCPDGSTVLETNSCPTEKTLVCPISGDQVKTLDECPAADFKTCSDGKKVLKNVDCPQEKKICPDGKTERVSGKECPITDKDVKKIEELKKTYLKRLEELEAFFKSIGDATLFDKTVKLKESLTTLPLTAAGLDILDSVETDIRLLNEERNDIEQKKKVEDDGVRDEENRVKALKGMKNAVKGFARQVEKTQNVIKETESKKIKISSIDKGNKVVLVNATIAVPDELQEILHTMKDAVTVIVNAETYDDAEDAIENLRASIEDIDSYEMYLRAMQGGKLAGIIQDIYKNIVKGDRELALLKIQLKKDEQKELAEPLQEAEHILNEVRDDAKKLLQGQVTDVDIDDFTDEFIYEKLTILSDSINDMRQIQRFTIFVKDTNGKFLRYTKELSKKNSKLKSDVKEQVRALVSELSCFIQTKADMPEACAKIKEETGLQVIDMNKLTKEKKTQFNEKVLPIVERALDIMAKLDELLGVKGKSALLKEFDVMKGRLDKLKSFDLPDLEESITSASARANFYRVDSRTEFARILKSRGVSYSQFAENQ
jgi:hypothetical protein